MIIAYKFSQLILLKNLYFILKSILTYLELFLNIDMETPKVTQLSSAKFQN